MGSERREIVRHAICLPVKILFLGTRPVAGHAMEGAVVSSRPSGSASFPPSVGVKVAAAAASTARIPAAGAHGAPESSKGRAVHLDTHPYYALALDVSSEGLLVEVSGVATRRFVEDADMLPKVEVLFCTPELAAHGPLFGHVRWSRQSGQGFWRLGMKLDARLTPLVLQHVLDVGQNKPKSDGRIVRDVVCVAVTAALSLGLAYQRSSIESEARRHLIDVQTETEGSVERAQQELSACRAERATEPARMPVVAGAMDASVVDAARFEIDAGASTPLAVEVADARVPPDEAVRAALTRAFERALDAAAADASTPDD